MLLMTDYAKNYASTICQSLPTRLMSPRFSPEPISHGNLFIELEVTD